MTSLFLRVLKALCLTSSALLCLYSSILVAGAAAPPAIPPNIVTVAAKPMIMLNLSRDHELFTRAYNEYSDIDSDGVPDTTYKHSFDYYGYFDSYKCYTYSSGSFVPASITTDKYCTGQWSGNFLNWATMTKMDVLRKILYGGDRSTDTASSTLLERANLPPDTHSFAKYYFGEDLSQLAPFTADQLAPTRTQTTSGDQYKRSFKYQSDYDGEWYYPSTVPSNAPKNGDSCSDLVTTLYGDNTPPEDYNCVWFDTGSAFTTSVFTNTWFQVDVGDQMIAEKSDEPGVELRGTVITLDDQSVNPGRFGMVVTKDGFPTPEVTSANYKWKFRNVSKQSVTMCNTTTGSSTAWSYNNTNAPLMRVARGNYQLWNANERWQCLWSEEKGASNANNISKTGLGAASSSPSKTSMGVTIGSEGPDFTVRVQACVTGKVGKERCKQYPDGNLKPIGLLHEYGESDQAEFALFTGSWKKNVAGGVLRSNMKSFKTEVNVETNGTFTSDADLVNTLNKMRIYGYRYSDGTYIGDTYSGGQACTYQLTTDVVNNMCTDWGNPMGEMFTESLRYLAGKSPTSDFDFTLSGSKDASLNMPKPAWIDPFERSNATEKAAIEKKFGPAQCRRINAINFNSSNISFDEDLQAPFATISGATVVNLVDIIGAAEGVHGKSWFVGSNGATDNRICDAKSITSLGSVRGMCPDAPAYKGTFGIAGAAYWAWTNPVRSDIDSGGAPDAFRVKTYSVALSTSKPRITIKHPTNGKVVELQPSYMNSSSLTAPGAGTLIDFKVIEQTKTSGRYLVIWEDSQQGGDRDQDHAGILRWEIVGDELHVFTSNYVESTSTKQGFGYTTSGTNKDGPHFHTGIEGFSFTDPQSITTNRVTGTANYRLNASGGCDGCQVNDPESRAIYTFSGKVAGVLQDPLWYASKWGGFNKVGGLTAPGSTSTWDVKLADGQAGSDGVPDNYFYAIRPAELENSLRAVFQDIVASSNTAPAVASAQLTEGSLKYVVRFDGEDAHGEISSYAITTDGSFSTAPTWKAHEKLTATTATSRNIITNEGASGVALRWDSLASTTRETMFGTDTLAQARFNWYRGDRSNEAPAGSGFRARNSLSVMGSVINSNPHVQRKPRAEFFGSAFPGYASFITSNKLRRPVIWVGSNDGMLHGFDASSYTSGGNPILSFVPQPLHSKLTGWVSSGAIQAMADGSAFTADVLHTTTGTTQAWATYLFSSLGRGGKGVYALDVTDAGTYSSAGALTSSGTLNETHAADIFRWQFTEADDTSGDLGYIVEQDNTTSRFSGQAASVAKMNNGKFAVMFGNGVESITGKAVLYILFVDGPSAGAWSTTGTTLSYVKLVADTGTDNGLSQPTWIDTTGDGVADYIYAGDLKGNLWKFDVSSTDPSTWAKAYHGKPLFQASAPVGNTEVAQPISSAPEYRFHPKGGVLVSFATGKALSSADFPDASGRPHTIYGIWDNPGFAGMDVTKLADTSTGLPRLRTRLTARTLTRQSSGDGYVEGDPIDWSIKMGWYVNLPATSEMVIANPQVTSLKLLAVVSIAPISGASSCSSAPDAFITLVDPITGLLYQNVMGEMDVVIDGKTVKKKIASTKLDSGDQNINIAKDRTKKCKAGDNCIRIVGDKTDKVISAGSQNIRIQWREIFNFRTGLD